MGGWLGPRVGVDTAVCCCVEHGSCPCQALQVTSPLSCLDTPIVSLYHDTSSVEAVSLTKSPSWYADSHSASQEIPNVYGTRSFMSMFTTARHWSLSSVRFIQSTPKVKLSLCFNWAPRHEGVLGEWRYSSTHSLTSALDGGEWSASRPCRFTPRERAPGYHWKGGWVDPRAVLDAVV
jgi:hypothetical protein